jgi:predicted flap endonuclease-1-like 5' DNA nuclease
LLECEGTREPARPTARAFDDPTVNGLTLLALIALAIVAFVAYRAGVMRGRREARSVAPSPFASPPPTAPATPLAPIDRGAIVATAPIGSRRDIAAADRPDAAGAHDAELVQLRAFAEDRRALLASLADARAETARYRQIVVDIENNAPPPLLASPNAPDDLKLIVGVGPVLERMLQQLGVSTYRQIARWTERDIDEFDARLPEFHGRVRRDDWVTQARELHLSKYGERP